MNKIELSEEEAILLKHHLKFAPIILLRLKSQAILMETKGMSIEDISDIISKDVRTVTRWFQDFFTQRMASIFTGHQDNDNANKLTKKQKEEIRLTLQQPPSAQSIPKEFWDVPTLKEYVHAVFGVVYESPRSYHFLLRFSKLSFKYPDTFDRHRDEEKITERMKEIRNEIRPLLNNEQWEVFTSDEVRIELESHTRRAWLKRGERTIIKVDRKREAQSYIGFLNQKSFACHVYEMPWQNQDEVLKAFKEFLQKYPEKKICIVWDNAAFHKGLKIREALKAGGLLDRVHLIAMPPYAPDQNPIEHVWNIAKGAIANTQFNVFEQTRGAFKEYIQSRTFHYEI